MGIDERDKCQAVVDNYVKYAKQNGSQSQYRRALEVLLPYTAFFDYLEGRIWHPSLTYARIAEITEKEETEKINSLIGQRRTRLGAKLDQVALQTKREVWAYSQLEDLYGAIIDWADDNSETRRQTEEKLLRHAYDHLIALQGSDKTGKLVQVRKMAAGMVILKHPFPLAWSIVLEWKDIASLGDLDGSLLVDYNELFPDHGLSKVIRGYLSSDISPFPQEIREEHDRPEDGERRTPIITDERLLLMTEGVDDSGESVIGYRMMAETYLALEEYESAVDISRKALKSLTKQSAVSGLSFVESKDAIDTCLGTCLIYHQAPRNHPEAQALFDGILKRKPFDNSALIGIGLVLEEQEHYDQALDFFKKALRSTSDMKVRVEAGWCEALNGDIESGLKILEQCLSSLETSNSTSKSLRSTILYRIGWCLWELDPSKKARRDREGAYARFLASIQANISHAPAYTRLGVFYADYARDPKRARKCFQKAFELSPSEVEAAERLARSFAATKEWDMVELVSQRVIDSGKCKPSPGSKKKGFSWPFAALGVVHLNNQAYQKSIVSYQAALRISPDDFNSWLGLGEGYASYGRYVAATKALERAIGLCHGNDLKYEVDVWFAEYLLGNVKRQLGRYDEAVMLYRKVLVREDKNHAATISLLQTLVEDAQSNIELGFISRAARLGVEALFWAMEAAAHYPLDSGFWKAFGDACSLFASAQSYLRIVPIIEVHSFIRSHGNKEGCALIQDIDGITDDALITSSEDGTAQGGIHDLLRAALLAQKLAVYEATKDRHAQAAAWYNLGWTEYQGHLQKLEDSSMLPARKAPRFLKAAVQCFKWAIECEAGNAEFWNAMGVVTSDLNVLVAQHSFVRSLHINDKDPRTWTNYGVLCFLNDDIELANKAFGRAQSADPDYALAWLAQGLVATRIGDEKEAQDLFTHALKITDASSTAIGLQYAQAKFDSLIASPSSKSNTEDLLSSLMTLQHTRYQIPNHPPTEHLSALFAERVGDFRAAEKTLESLSTKLEQDYEASESAEILERFAQVKADLARVSLALQEYDNAIQHAATAIDIAGEEDTDNKTYHRVRLSARICAALARLHESDKAEALKELRYLTGEGNHDPDMTCLISRALWVEGSEASKAAARDQLFEAAEKHPGHAQVVMLLGAIAVMDDDRDTAEAVANDLRSLQMSEHGDAVEQDKLETLLTCIASIGVAEGAQAAYESAETKRAIMLNPWRARGWSQLNKQGNSGHPAEMAVLNAVKSVPPFGPLGVERLCQTYAGSRKKDDAHRAVFVAPWIAAGWEALQEVES